MACYVVSTESKGHLVEERLPFRSTLRKTGDTVELELLRDPYRATDLEALFSCFQDVLEEGKTYPQEGPVTFESFKAYYLSHDVFVLREVEPNKGEIRVHSIGVRPRCDPSEVLVTLVGSCKKGAFSARST